MLILFRKDDTLLIETKEPHVYATEIGLSIFLRQHMLNEKREHWLVFTGAEEKILEAHRALKPHIAKWPEHYLDNMILSLLRADGLSVHPCLVDDCPPGKAQVSPKRIAIACNIEP